jgi:glycosyl transferase family 25
MQVLIINLARAQERMALQVAQMVALNLPFERIEAVTPETLDPPSSAPVWRRWQRPMRATEMALIASHWAAWRRVITLDVPCLILEDDALLSSQAPAFLAKAAQMRGWDHISLETRSRKKVVGHLHPDLPMRRMYQDRTGSAAYLLTPQGAGKLLAATTARPAPSDAAISSTYTLRSFQADPALSIQLDQCAAYGVPQPIPTKSYIDAVGKPPAMTAREHRAFRWRRITAQLRMGWQHLGHLPSAHRRHIDPAAEWPKLDPKIQP